jgi:hypothetical protein
MYRENFRDEQDKLNCFAVAVRVGVAGQKT